MSEQPALAKPRAFVIMPFNAAPPINGGYKPLDRDDLDTVFGMIRSCLEDLGYKVVRSDSPGPILRDIVRELDRSDLVVADLTSLNPNVMYELGIRHGFCKKTILLTQDISELPFDLKGYQSIQYRWITDRDKRQFRESLRHQLELIDQHDDPLFGPVHTYLGAKQQGVADERRRITVKRLQALFHEIGYVLTTLTMRYEALAKRFPEVFSINIKNGWSVRINRKRLRGEAKDALEKFIRLNMNLPAIDLILATSYVPDEFDSFGEVSKMMDVLRVLRNADYIAESADHADLSFTVALSMDLLVMVGKLIRAVETNAVGQRIGQLDWSEGLNAVVKKGWEEELEELKMEEQPQIERTTQGATPEANRALRGRRRRQ